MIGGLGGETWLENRHQGNLERTCFRKLGTVNQLKFCQEMVRNGEWESLVFARPPSVAPKLCLTSLPFCLSLSLFDKF